MRMGYKLKIFLVAAILFAPSLARASLFDELDAVFKDPLNTAKSVNMTCIGYNSKSDADRCRSCRESVHKWRDDLPEIAKKVEVNDGLLSSGGGLLISGAADGATNNTKAFQSQGKQTDIGSKTSAERSKSAGEASDKMKKCVGDIEKACGGKPPAKLTGTDRSSAESMQKACEDAAKGTGKFADQKKADSKGMGDMKGLMDAASAAMKAASAMQPQQEQPPPASDVNANPAVAAPVVAEAPKVESNKFDEKGGVAKSTVGFGSPDVAKIATDNAGQGSLTGLASTSASRGLASNGLPSGTGASAPSSSGSGGGGGGGGASGGSSGASRPGEGGGAVDAAAQGGNYEVSPGGGGRAIVGLKPSKGDLADVAEGAPPPLDAAKLDELGNRDPNAENAAADDALAHDGESIFLRVRQKYSLLKGAGRI